MRTARSLGLAAAIVLMSTSLSSAGSTFAHRASIAFPASTIYAGLQNGGIYRSTDGGESWQEIDNGIALNVNVTALQGNAIGTAYAGTSGAGVFISTDGGASWQPDNGGNEALANTNVVGLAVNPQYSEDVYAATQDGTVYVSYSGGQYWRATQVSTSSTLTALVDEPQDAGTLLVGTKNDGIYRATGYTFNWQPTTGIPSDTAVNAIAVDPANALVAYAATDDGIYQSIDGGESWQPERQGITDGSIMLSITVDPHNGGHVIAGTADGVFYRSSDGGTSWQYEGASGSTPINALVYDPSSPTSNVVAGLESSGDPIYIGVNDGLYWRAALDASFYTGGVLSLAVLARPTLPTSPVLQPYGSSPDERYFPQTHHILRGALISFYDKNGGLAVFGLPLTEQFIENGQLVQYFERARLAQVGNRVLVSALGTQVTNGRYFPAARPFASSRTRLYFSATGHSLSGRFLTFWQKHHGALLFGAPISEPLREQNGDGTGRAYLVQYFQNARLEYHPELSGSSYEVSLGQLGRQLLKQRGWL